MYGRDERLDPVRSFTAKSFRLAPERWREFVTMEDNQVILNSFFSTPDYTNLFISRDSEARLLVGLNCPKNVQTKVICVSKTGREAITKDNAREMLLIQEVVGGDAISFFTAVSEEVVCLSFSTWENSSSSWASGVTEEVVRFTERQKNEALVIKAQIEGRVFLPHPNVLGDADQLGKAVHEEPLLDEAVHEGAPQDEPLRDTEGRKLSDVKLLHACDSTIIEWAELVSEFLKQDSSQAVLDGLKPLPSEEFNFWRTRLNNLHFIQKQLRSSRAQQVASIVQKAESVYWATLRDIYRDVQEGLKEGEDVTLNLGPVQEKLEQVEKMEYQQVAELQSVCGGYMLMLHATVTPAAFPSPKWETFGNTTAPVV
ncbi:dynein heavy chain 17, axonemal-like, partial [Etheostoma cragini]|uniref:dynein heavy chain 17, axonemal-like n=1 Tax=Etheostoma cragini TaxID=417921 RepID=UPI00155ED287